MCHINFAQYMVDRKGITDRVTLNGMTLMNWDIYLMPMDEPYVQSVTRTTSLPENMPGTYFSGNFNINTPGDTYFDLSGYSKGMVYVNGHNLGRYWNIGPQQKLYCPAPWLKKGDNEIIVFDLLQSSTAPIKGAVSLE